MKTVRELLEEWKVQEIFRISPSLSVSEAAMYMTGRNIGAVAVMEDDRVVGVISERDILVRVVQQGLKPEDLKVRQVMSPNLVTVSPDDTSVDCLIKMQTADCRHVLVMEGSKFIGMISVRDILSANLDDKAEEVELLDSYVWGTSHKNES